jgi:tripartite-type tricarboxylate transporter receptor subunit TctC
MTIKNVSEWLVGVVAALVLSAGPVLAQTYPAQTIRIIVPYTAGGVTDAATRIVAGKMQESMGQPVVVENRSGASGIIGTSVVSKAAADGYTLGVISISHTALSSLFKSLPFDPVKDFAPIALIASAPSVLVASHEQPFRTLPEAVAYIRANPAKALYASAGAGTLSHLQSEWLKRDRKLAMVHVPFKGAAAAALETMSGRVTLYFDTLTTAAPHIQSGRLRSLAVTSARRSPLLPDTPTMLEAGFPGFVATAWLGLVAPAHTSIAILERLNVEVAKALAAPDTRERLLRLGTETEGGSAARFEKFLEHETARWSTLISEVNITAE